ncbi:autophagy-related protein 27 [Xylariaceae sp. FL1651]|nr:autophagy-related protein 27 [Xylariaceae sp. FL1651]
MKFSTIPNADTALLLSLLLVPLPVAAMLKCDHIVSDGQQYNLKKLGGPHSVVTSKIDGGYAYNTTYTVDICTALKKKGDVDKNDQCANGSRVCAIERKIRTGGDNVDVVTHAFPIAGELKMVGGGALDHKVARLSKVNPELGKEGLRIIMKGGFYETSGGAVRNQQAVIDFVCDRDRDGTEGEYDSEDKYEPDGDTSETRTNPLLYRSVNAEAEADDDTDAPAKEVQLGIEKNPSLVFNRYGFSDSDPAVDVLHLTWSSKYVCDNKADDGSDGTGDGEGDDGAKQPGSRWGVFTWIVVLVFFGTAAYLIVGSWLNYNRYGARGWDLLPHGDTIRDIPYLMKDWARRVLNTVQGSGSRGGYSAV